MLARLSGSSDLHLSDCLVALKHFCHESRVYFRIFLRSTTLLSRESLYFASPTFTLGSNPECVNSEATDRNASTENLFYHMT